MPGIVHPGLLQVLELGVDVLLPEVLQLVDLSGGDLPGSQLLGVPRDLDQPADQLAVRDERLPGLLVPVHVLQAVLGGAGLPAQHHHHAVRLGGDEAGDEDVPAGQTPDIVL